MPSAPVHDLIVKNDDLVVATHGRAFWILDDLTPLRELTPDVASDSVHLFKPRPALRSLRDGFPAHGAVGQNPPGGAVIYYTLKSAPKSEGEAAGKASASVSEQGSAANSPQSSETGKPAAKGGVQIQILDSRGQVIRQYPPKQTAESEGPSEFPEFHRSSNAPPAEKGLNRFVWDLRHEPATRVQGSAHWGGSGEGPHVLPGSYQVKLTVEGHTYEAPLEVKLDPRITTPQPELEKQLDLALKIRDQLSADHDAVNQIRSVRSQLNELKKRLAADSQAKNIVDAANALDEKMTPVEEKLLQVKSKSSEDPLNYPIQLDDKLAALESTVESADAAPTAQCFTVFDLLNSQLEAELETWRQIRSQDLAAFNALARKENLPVIAAPEEPPAGSASAGQ